MTARDDAHDTITVVLVTYNSRAILPLALASLADAPHVTIVDNGSADGTPALARALMPRAEVIEAGANLGFGRANNLALEKVRTPYALLLNPDCELQPGAIAALLEATRRYPEAAIWGPKVYDAPGRLGLCYRPPFYARQPDALIDPDGDLCTEFLTGAAMLLNLRLMRAVGFFDPWFFLYLEDDDLCLRARRAGHPLVLVAAAQVLHRVKQSSAPAPRLAFRRAYCMTLSKFYLHRKVFGPSRLAGMVVRIGIGALLALPVYALMFDRTRLLRSAGRLAAALRARARLAAEHCFESRD
jgi:N-acetylglucosaminyl-diphospho-decaprenol L-rhamnosyltransferase